MKNKDQNDNRSPLEKHVDEMMDLSSPEPKKDKAVKRDTPKAEPIDIFSELKTAPTLQEESEKDADAQEPTNVQKSADNDAVETKPDAKTQQPEEDAATDKAVEDILKNEGDRLLQSDTDSPAVSSDPQPNAVARLFAAWWHNKVARYGALALVLAVIAGGITQPQARYAAMNLVGLRASATVTVLDGTTNLPLKNVEITAGTTHTFTDKQGRATLMHIKLGPQTLAIKRVAFATVTKPVSLSLGNNAIGMIVLKAVGSQYHFQIVDYLSGKPVGSAEAASGQANAVADKKGQIVLTVNDPNAQSFDVTISGTGYRINKIKVAVGTDTATNVVLVPARKDVFVSKASGTYDVYTIDIDGQNKHVLLKGTGREDEQITLLDHPTDDEVALVSKRDTIRDGDGYVLQGLTFINAKTGAPLTVDHSEQIQIVDWIGNKLVYVRIKAGASAGNPERYQLISYDYKTKSQITLASANAFNDVASARGSIYYAASNNFDGGKSAFAKINADGTGKQALVEIDAWNAFRADYLTFNVQTAGGWYSYHGSGQATKLSGAPATGANRVYIDSPDGHASAWIDIRDGKGVLLTYDPSTQKDAVRATVKGLTYPVHWLDNYTLIYRVVTPQETADYALSLAGGAPRKVADVTNASGITRWYYY
jgi:hypothetical protein